eukprot:GHVT01010632.1.p1 GENE.GHVT01010632.1~~GHVT01010632.1.p1  ORF type:complete len:309 (-),score=56.97 GHVT01010632.1:90-1016(-)
MAKRKEKGGAEAPASPALDNKQANAYSRRDRTSSPRRKPIANSQPAAPADDKPPTLDEDLFVASIRDEDLCKRILGQEVQSLQDVADFLVAEHRLADDESTSAGPPKFSFREGDSYDWHAALGCLNCGAALDVRENATRVISQLREEGEHPVASAAGSHGDSAALPAPALTCTACGQRACPVFFDTDSDALCDSLALNSEVKNQPAPQGLYLYGQRQIHRFGKAGKKWWQAQFLPQDFRDLQMDRQLRVVAAMGERAKSAAAPTCTEVCNECGHDQAFYRTFQARSADEGMTIMFECCQCGARKVFNS